jgi:hypothetical protein
MTHRRAGTPQAKQVSQVDWSSREESEGKVRSSEDGCGRRESRGHMRKTSNYLRERTFHYQKYPCQLIHSSGLNVNQEASLHSAVVGPDAQMDGHDSRCGHTRMRSCFFRVTTRQSILLVCSSRLPPRNRRSKKGSRGAGSLEFLVGRLKLRLPFPSFFQRRGQGYQWGDVRFEMVCFIQLQLQTASRFVVASWAAMDLLVSLSFFPSISPVRLLDYTYPLLICKHCKFLTMLLSGFKTR